MLISRRQIWRCAIGAIAPPLVSHVAAAQNYPTRPVHLVVTVPAGGSPDIVARLLGQWLSEHLAQPFVIENRPGASANIGTEFVVRAAPDGHTLLVAMSANAINASLYPNLNYNFIRDAAPVALIGRIPLVLIANPLLPAKKTVCQRGRDGRPNHTLQSRRSPQVAMAPPNPARSWAMSGISRRLIARRSLVPSPM